MRGIRTDPPNCAYLPGYHIHRHSGITWISLCCTTSLMPMSRTRRHTCIITSQTLPVNVWLVVDSSNRHQAVWWSVHGVSQCVDSSNRHQAVWWSVHGVSQCVDTSNRHQAVWWSVHGVSQCVDPSNRHQAVWRSVHGVSQCVDSSNRHQAVWRSVHGVSL